MANYADDAEKEGAKAIIFLQGLEGIEETEDSALEGWRRLCVRHKDQTMRAYLLLSGTSDRKPN